MNIEITGLIPFVLMDLRFFGFFLAFEEFAEVRQLSTSSAPVLEAQREARNRRMSSL
jgi:hypothetical protein